MKLSARGTALLLGVAMTLLTMVIPTAAAAAAPVGGQALAVPPPGMLYQLQNVTQGQCLAGQSSNRVNISQCERDFDDQFWHLEPIGDPGFFRLRGLETGKCLAIISNQNVRISSCVDGFNDQWWRLDPTPDFNAFQMFNHNRQRCLAGPRGQGAATSLSCDPSSRDQRWIFLSA